MIQGECDPSADLDEFTAAGVYGAEWVARSHLDCGRSGREENDTQPKVVSPPDEAAAWALSIKLQLELRGNAADRADQKMGSDRGNIPHYATNWRRRIAKVNLAILEQPMTLKFPLFFHCRCITHGRAHRVTFASYA